MKNISSNILCFSETCYYEDTGYNLTTDRISTSTDLKSVKDCADLCDNTADCLYFQYSAQTNGQFVIADIFKTEMEKDERL